MHELTLSTELPQMRISETGKPLFNKGNTLWKRVRMTEELKARKREILRDIRSKIPPESYSHVRSRSVVAIKDGVICLRYRSIADATRKTGINCISRSCRTGIRAGEYCWYYEDDNRWTEIVNQNTFP